MKNLFIIIGLGNPGNEYKYTRHNFGFMVTDKLSANLDFSRWKSRKLYYVSQGFLGKSEIILAKPKTYMNLSGNAALSLMTTFKASPANLLIVFDDMSLPFGKIRFRPSGGTGGHKGLDSIIQSTGRSDIPRLKIGIGVPENKEETVNYVLSKFTPEEKEKMEDILKSCIEGIKTYIKYGIDITMNEFN